MDRLQEVKDRYMYWEYNFNLSREDTDWLIEQAKKVERYEKALQQLAKADGEEFLKWQEEQEKRGNDLNEWDWFSSLAKLALRTHPNK